MLLPRVREAIASRGSRKSVQGHRVEDLIKVTEEDARLSLLIAELGAIQTAIRSFDTIDFQIKGWCVTASLAIGGVAVAYRRPELLLVGAAAVLGFFLLDCQFKQIQRVFIDRNHSIDKALRAGSVVRFLEREDGMVVTGTAIPVWQMLPRGSKLRFERNLLRAIFQEARLPNTYSLYLLIALCLTAEAAVLI
jgi:hypothetical protein